MVSYRGSLDDGSATFGSLSTPATGATAAPAIGSVTISPNGGTITVGSTLQLSAVAKNAQGAVISSPSLTWTSLSTNVATVNSSGRVTAQSVGTALITVAGLCCGADTVAVVVQAAPPPAVGTIEVTPDGGTIVGIGGTLELVATARTAQGAIVSSPGFVWTSLSNLVASVNSSGRVTANAYGTVRIAVSASCCSADTVTVTVTAPATLPPPPLAGVWFEEDWQGFASLPSNSSAPGIHYASNASIQTGALFDGSQGRFVRAQYPGGGGDGTATVALDPSQAVQDRPREIWGEVYVRVGSDWQIKTDDKTLFVMEDWRYVPRTAGVDDGAGEGEVWRWAIYLRSGSWGGPYGGPYYRLAYFENPPNMESDIFTGQWVRMRFHFKMASSRTATDGIYEVWLNDRRVTSRVGIRTDSDPQAFFRVLALGANADPYGSGARDWGRVRLFTGNPGW
jgi:hypothetical protein